jgi:hypothetical protein
MAIYYVRSTSTGANNGSSWANAFTTLAAALAVAAAADVIYVSQAHAETLGGVITLNFPGSPGLQVICADDSSEPPTATATTGSISVLGGSGALQLNGCSYIYGLTFNGATTTSNSNTVVLGATATLDTALFLEACRFATNTSWVGGTAVGVYMGPGPISNTLRTCNLLLRNCTFKFASTLHGIFPRSAVVHIEGGGLDSSGESPAALFRCVNANNGRCSLTWQGGDLTHCGSSLMSTDDGAESTTIDLLHCKVPSGASLQTGTLTPGGPTITLDISDSAATNYRYERVSFAGTVRTETAVFRADGALNGSTPYSIRLGGSAVCSPSAPLKTPRISYWNAVVGEPVTVTVEILTDGVTLTDAECWVDVFYMGTSGSPIALIATDRVATPLTAPANQSSSGAGWTTTGLSSPVKQALSATFTPEIEGYIQAVVTLAKASTPVFVCPKMAAA